MGKAGVAVRALGLLSSSPTPYLVIRTCLAPKPQARTGCVLGASADLRVHGEDWYHRVLPGRNVTRLLLLGLGG